MADSQLRLQIVTALDNAGLKATKEQIDGLEKSLSKTSKNGSSSFSGLGKAGIKAAEGLLHIPPALKAIMTAGGPVTIAIMAIVAAVKLLTSVVKGVGVLSREYFGQMKSGCESSFTAMQNIATNAWDTLKNKAKDAWDKFWTGSTESEKQAELEQNMKNHLKKVEEYSKKASDSRIQQMQNELAENKKVIDGINRQTAAYIQQSQTLSNLKNAKGDAQVLMLERQKFEERLNYEKQGQGEIADQISKAYDVEIQRVKNNAAVEQNALQQLQANEAAKKAEKALNEREKAVDIALAAKNEAQMRVAATNGSAAWKLAYKKAEKEYDAAVVAKDEAYEAAITAYGRVGEVQQNGANIRMSNQMALEMAMLGYDNWVAENGNVGNFQFDKQYIEQLNKTSETIKYAEETAANTADLAEKIEELLRVKEQ